ncbi:MAG TPA: hypothetical protein VKU42_15650 [Candidatus Angelobacter sp.]|nr:hypothetical protein [Candidatus Angelobacter sp.]
MPFYDTTAQGRRSSGWNGAAIFCENSAEQPSACALQSFLDLSFIFKRIFAEAEHPTLLKEQANHGCIGL